MKASNDLNKKLYRSIVDIEPENSCDSDSLLDDYPGSKQIPNVKAHINS